MKVLWLSSLLLLGRQGRRSSLYLTTPEADITLLLRVWCRRWDGRRVVSREDGKGKVVRGKRHGN